MAWALIVVGLALALSQVPTLTPYLPVFAGGLALALVGAAMLCDRPHRP